MSYKMGSNPLNLIFRFLLEVTALIVFGIWSWHLYNSILSYALATVIPLSLAVIWGIFAVPNDPSRSGKTIIKTPGTIRLVLELGFFGFAYWCMVSLGWEVASWIFSGSVLLHYLLSFDRIQWLLKN